MAERTIRRRKNGDTSITNGAGNGVNELASENGLAGEPVTIEPDGTVKPATIDDYELDGATDGNGTQFVDATSGTGSGSGAGDGRKRRSDAGTRRTGRRTRASASEATSSVANLLFSVHFGLSSLMGSDLIALSKEESEAYAKAVTNVSQLYDIPVIGEKALAWTNLVMVMGTIYGPRFVAAKMRKKQRPKVVTFEQPIHEVKEG